MSREVDLAEELAWKLNNPMGGLSEAALWALEDHAAACGEAGFAPSAEVRLALDGYRGRGGWPLPEDEGDGDGD